MTDLKKLQSVKFDEKSQWMNKEDALWMLEQWPDISQDTRDLIKSVGKIDDGTASAKEVFYEKLGVRVLRRENIRHRRRILWY